MIGLSEINKLDLYFIANHNISRLEIQVDNLIIFQKPKPLQNRKPQVHLRMQRECTSVGFAEFLKVECAEWCGNVLHEQDLFFGR